MNVCICCDNTLLRHIRHGDIYWYCPHCHQEMPGHTVDVEAQIIPLPEKEPVRL